MKKSFRKAGLALAALLLAPLAGHDARAESVWITPDLPFYEFTVQGKNVVIERNQDTKATIQGSFAKTSRPCPPFCIQPMVVAPGVKTVGEIELMQFLTDFVESGKGHLVDARLINWYDAGTIPGSVSLPFNLFDPKASPFFPSIMAQLGGKLVDGKWDFSEARHLMLFCNGPWCGQSPRAIRNLLSVGYPADKLYYYRGGMQAWQILGLPTVKPAGS